MRKSFTVAILLTISLSAFLRGADLKSASQERIVAKPFNLEDVRLLDGPFKEAMLLNRRYLLSLDVDRLLHNFRVNAGIESTAAPLGGWERPACELRGHFVGHYLTACSLHYAATGDEELKSRADQVVAGLAAVQEALAKRATPGYLSAFPESYIDRVEKRERVWAPYYTLHKLLAGLLDAYTYCHSQQALKSAAWMADWVGVRVGRLTREQMQASLDTEFGGMNNALARLAELTGEEKYLRLAQTFDHDRIFNPLAEGLDKLDGLHANTQIPKMIGAAREYELTGDARYERIARFFWERVALHRSYVIGGHSDHEHFFPVDKFAEHLSPNTAETCNTYNMLKLTGQLFGQRPTAGLMDFYERALYNHILASQDPELGMFVYLMSLKPGHFKSYSTQLDSFWCCVGTGVENHTKYGEAIYSHSKDSLFVNLFIPSQLTWSAKGVRLRQETKFPEEGRIRLLVKTKNPVPFSLLVRRPGWVTGPVSLRVNGQPVSAEPDEHGYLTITRDWSDGDTVQIDLPMALRWEPLPGSTQIGSLLYGPIVLAGELGTKGMPAAPYAAPYAANQWDHERIPGDPPPFFSASSAGASGADWLTKVKPVAGEALVFRTEGLGQPKDVELIPFYRMHSQRYTVYWELR